MAKERTGRVVRIEIADDETPAVQEDEQPTWLFDRRVQARPQRPGAAADLEFAYLADRRQAPAGECRPDTKGLARLGD